MKGLCEFLPVVFDFRYFSLLRVFVNIALTSYGIYEAYLDNQNPDVIEQLEIGEMCQLFFNGILETID